MNRWKLICLVSAVFAGMFFAGCSSCTPDEKKDNAASQEKDLMALVEEQFHGVLDLDGVELEMVKITPGKFTMGSPDTEQGRDKDERESVTTINHMFWLGKYEVTQAQWRAVMSPRVIDVDKVTKMLELRKKKQKIAREKGKAKAESAKKSERPEKPGEFELTPAMRFMITVNNAAAYYARYAPDFMLPKAWTPSEFKGDDRPVENVSHAEALAFCKRLNELYRDKLPPGYRFDLPTEAQWEYACRAGTNTALNNNTNLRDLKHDCENLEILAWYDFRGEGKCTHPVGKKMPNAWGLYDMHGNVFEWCRDRYSDRDYSKKEKTYSTADYVIRGGSWFSDAKSCRSAYRHWYLRTYRSSYIGFRVALVR